MPERTVRAAGTGKVGALPLACRCSPANRDGWRKKSVRSVWPSEVRGLTAWLSSDDGSVELSFLLGENAVPLGREVVLPGGRCDLVMRLVGPAAQDGQAVAVEASVEEADADHAARLLYYAAELGACAAVLVAAKIPPRVAKVLADQNGGGPASLPAVYGAEISCWRSKLAGVTAAALECRVRPGQELPHLGDGFRLVERERLAAHFGKIRNAYLENSLCKQPEPRIGMLCACLRCPTAVRGIEIEAAPAGRFAYVISAPDGMTRAGLFGQMLGERDHLQAGLAGVMRLRWPDSSRRPLGADTVASPGWSAGHMIRITGRAECRTTEETARILVRLERTFHSRAHVFRDDPLALVLA